MIDISLTGLVERLDAPCRNALVAATGECVTRTHYEVAIEHALLRMTESPEAHAKTLFAACGVEPARLARCLRKDLEGRARGNSGRPVFSPFLVEWLMDAWLIASIEYARESIDAGALWAALAVRPDRYVGGATAEYVKGSALAGLRKRLDELAPVPAPDTEPRREALPPDSPLAQFCISFSAEARAGRIDPVLGRDEEVRRMVDILARRRKNNPIVVGEPGTGKTALVEGLALRIASGAAPRFLRGVELLSLDLGLLQAGASVKGEFEKRLKDVIAAVEGMSHEVILFIDEAHMLIGAGGAPGGADAANLLKPALARGTLRAIAATTWKEYKKYFEKDAALSRRFQLVKLDAPSPAETVNILRGLRERFEHTHGLYIRDEAIEAAVRLSSRHIAGGQLPDKAIDVLDTTAARVRISRSGEPAEVERVSGEIAALEREAFALGRDRVAGGNGHDATTTRTETIRASLARLGEQRDALVRRWEEERALAHRIASALAAVSAASGQSASVSSSLASGDSGTRSDPSPSRAQGEDTDEEARPASGATGSALDAGDALADLTVSHGTKPPDSSELGTLRARLAEVQGQAPLVHCEVTADAVAQTVSQWTGVPLGVMARNEAGDALGFACALRARVRGQEQAVEILDRELRIARAGLADPERPRGVFLLVGPSGVGKTETAGVIAELLLGGAEHMTVVSLSEYQEKHTVSRLFGAPPGYVGYGEGGVLTEAVRRRPYSIVLLDEAEKAHPEVLNAFYQVFDKGVMADGEGREVDFRNTVIVLTSNLGADRLDEVAVRHAGPADAGLMAEALRPALAAHFKPALLARMRVVPYAPLDAQSLREIVVQRIERIGARARARQGLELVCTDAAIERIATHCVRSDGGARNIDALVNQTLLPRISTEILSRMQHGGRLMRAVVGVGPQGEFSYEIS